MREGGVFDFLYTGSLSVDRTRPRLRSFVDECGCLGAPDALRWEECLETGLSMSHIERGPILDRVSVAWARGMHCAVRGMHCAPLLPEKGDPLRTLADLGTWKWRWWRKGMQI